MGEVTFQSVDRCTHECYWFLSHQRHRDGPLRPTINQSFLFNGVTHVYENQAQATEQQITSGSETGIAMLFKAKDLPLLTFADQKGSHLNVFTGLLKHTA